MLDWTEYAKICLALLVIVNPVGAVPLFAKCLLHAGITQVGERMRFLIQRRAAPTDRHRGAQQLPAPIGREVAPINHDQRFAQRSHHAAREHLIQIKTLGSEMVVTEQPIDTLDVVFRARRADRCAAQLGERESPRTHRSADRRQEHGQPSGVQTRATRSNQLLYDIERMHGAVSFEGWSPSKKTLSAPCMRRSGHPKRKIPACGISARPEAARNDRNCQKDRK